MWLQKESVDRGATIIYATHIFDGLDEWPTHLTYLTRYCSDNYVRVAILLRRYDIGHLDASASVC